ncbi:hypothetical protein PM082_013711 [Marasmius tenuissimus]|nr:hypothetical protein PM082_013711 [Marasmius tenuissimus]
MFSTASSAMIVETIIIFHGSMAQFAAVKAQDYSGFNRYVLYDTLRFAAIPLTGLIFFISNVLADCMLIHRCYLICNHQRMSALMVAACFFVNVALLTGVTMTALSRINPKSEQSGRLISEGQIIVGGAMVASAFLNVILTCLTAGRLWWIGIRPTESAGVKSTYAKKYQSVLRIILESGMIYPLTLVAHLVIIKSSPQPPFDPFPFLVLAAGIAPTLIIVRARLGVSSTPTVEDIPTYSQMSFHVPDRSTTNSGVQADGV